MTIDLATLSDRELRAAALSAEVALRLDAAYQYGFITPDPKVDIGRCEEAIAEALGRGINFTEEEIDEGIAAFVTEAARATR